MFRWNSIVLQNILSYLKYRRILQYIVSSPVNCDIYRMIRFLPIHTPSDQWYEPKELVAEPSDVDVVQSREPHTSTAAEWKQKSTGYERADDSSETRRYKQYFNKYCSIFHGYRVLVNNHLFVTAVLVNATQCGNKIRDRTEPSLVAAVNQRCWQKRSVFIGNLFNISFFFAENDLSVMKTKYKNSLIFVKNINPEIKYTKCIST